MKITQYTPLALTVTAMCLLPNALKAQTEFQDASVIDGAAVVETAPTVNGQLLTPDDGSYVYDGSTSSAPVTNVGYYYRRYGGYYPPAYGVYRPYNVYRPYYGYRPYAAYRYGGYYAPYAYPRAYYRPYAAPYYGYYW